MVGSRHTKVDPNITLLVACAERQLAKDTRELECDIPIRRIEFSRFNLPNSYKLTLRSRMIITLLSV